MADGTARIITLRGVGYTARVCARDLTADSVWLDRLASVRQISHETESPVKAVFPFKDGVQRQASIGPGNRALYVEGRFGRTEKLDLGSLAKIDFE